MIRMFKAVCVGDFQLRHWLIVCVVALTVVLHLAIQIAQAQSAVTTTSSKSSQSGIQSTLAHIRDKLQQHLSGGKQQSSAKKKDSQPSDQK